MTNRTCNCFWCEEDRCHPINHNAWMVVSPDKGVQMVACETCGHLLPYNPQVHVNVMDLGM